MERTPFFGYFEQAWIDHQTDYGQHADPCTGLSPDQIQDRVASWLAGFCRLVFWFLYGICIA